MSKDRNIFISEKLRYKFNDKKQWKTFRIEIKTFEEYKLKIMNFEHNFP